MGGGEGGMWPPVPLLPELFYNISLNVHSSN